MSERPLQRLLEHAYFVGGLREPLEKTVFRRLGRFRSRHVCIYGLAYM